MSTRLSQHPPIAVLDSQAVLDWLYFGDPVAAGWEEALASGRWRWWVGAGMRDELSHVLGRGHLPAPRRLSPDALLAQLDHWAEVRESPLPVAHGALRCSDRDDQKFLDFAAHHPVRWLVSRDRAVLKLRRRAATLHQLQILTPADWSQQLQRPSPAQA